MRAAARDAWISISATMPWNLRLLGCELGDDAAQTQRLPAQRGPHPVLAAVAE